MTKKNKSFLQSISKAYYNIEMFIMTFFTMGVGALIIVEIIIRNTGFQGIKWLEELSRYMLVITTLIGCSMAVKEDGHMIMDLIFTKLSTKASCLLKAFVNLICGAFWLYLGYYAVEWTMRLVRIMKIMDSINLPFYIVWIPVSIALITMGIRYFIQTKKCLVSYKTAACRNKEGKTC